MYFERQGAINRPTIWTMRSHGACILLMVK